MNVDYFNDTMFKHYVL